jgi:ubiquinone/menaquinone biosynthesis C-methylase UbiE
MQREWVENAQGLSRGAKPLPTQRAPEGFPDVDQSADPDYWVDYLDRISAERRFARQRAYDLLGVRAGDQILDVGCGTGEAARELAVLVGNGGRVVGLDRSETMIREARRRAQGLRLPITFQLGDARQLHFANDCFDGCRAGGVFMHLDNPERALVEMCRVTRPGGRIVITEPDVESLIVDAPDLGLTRSILSHYCDNFLNGWMGRQLPRLFHQAGLDEITVTPWTHIGTQFSLAVPDGGGVFALQRAAALAQSVGVVSNAEAERWLQQLEAASQAGHFLYAITDFIVSGRKP